MLISDILKRIENCMKNGMLNLNFLGVELFLMLCCNFFIEYGLLVPRHYGLLNCMINFEFSLENYFEFDYVNEDMVAKLVLLL